MFCTKQNKIIKNCNKKRRKRKNEWKEKKINKIIPFLLRTHAVALVQWHLVSLTISVSALFFSLPFSRFYFIMFSASFLLSHLVSLTFRIVRFYLLFWCILMQKPNKIRRKTLHFYCGFFSLAVHKFSIQNNLFVWLRCTLTLLRFLFYQFIVNFGQVCVCVRACWTLYRNEKTFLERGNAKANITHAKPIDSFETNS